MFESFFCLLVTDLEVVFFINNHPFRVSSSATPANKIHTLTNQLQKQNQNENELYNYWTQYVIIVNSQDNNLSLYYIDMECLSLSPYSNLLFIYIFCNFLSVTWFSIKNLNFALCAGIVRASCDIEYQTIQPIIIQCITLWYSYLHFQFQLYFLLLFIMLMPRKTKTKLS